MAELGVQHVVNETQSMGDMSSVDVPENSHISNGSGEVDSNGEKGEQPELTTAHAQESYHTFTSDPVENSKDSFTTPATHSGTANEQPDTSATMSDEQEPMLNGDGGSYDGSEDAGYQHSALGDTALSDTDANRGDGVEQLAADGKNERLGTLKRPASFKPVSVTKNFLAKSATGAAAAAKPAAEKLIASTSALVAPPIAKPRLVAKSGRDARLVGMSTGLGASGPDASKVWNRNQPVAPPPPKQFTDEELKQQYGIHLATRLQSDETGKESKWADIDDDEDDWAPEATVEWMDGTKSTATTNDGKLILGASRVLTQSEAEDAAKAAALAAQRASSLPSVGKTILRPSVRTSSQTKPGLILKSVPESSSTPEKSTTTTSSKSPWAPLPPVDKASPITFNPPASAVRLPAGVPRDLSLTETGPPVTSPAAEIAADDFSRGWRDGERNSRELFNSQSGRYEPVKGGRRPSRQESGLRAPALLQRPSQQAGSQYADGPLASERDRSGPEAGGRAWARRSESTGVQERNASERGSERSSDPPADARALTPSSAANHSALVDDNKPPQSGGRQPFSARTVETRDISHDASTASQQDIVTAQRQLMRENLEKNRKRKQEEEAREEAARKERIRVKMEALAQQEPPRGAPSPQTTQQSQQSADQSMALEPELVSEVKPSDPGIPVTEKQVEKKIINKEPSPQKQSKRISEPERRAIAESGPTIVAPQPSSLSKQSDVKAVLESKAATFPPPSELRPGLETNAYGASRAPRQTGTKTPPGSERIASSRPIGTPARSPVLGGQRLMQSLADNHEQLQQVQELPGLGRISPADGPTQHWNSLPPSMDGTLGWPGSNSLHAGNVWGPISKDKPLGNGAFGSDFTMSSPMQQRMHHSQVQPNNVHQRMTARSPNVGFDSGPSMPLMSPAGLQEEIAHNQQWRESQVAAPPASQYSQRHFGLGLAEQSAQQQLTEQQEAAKRAWNSPGAAAPLDHRTMEVRQPQPEIVHPTFRETFRQTNPSNVLGQRKVVSVSKVVHEGQKKTLEATANPDTPGTAHFQPPPVQLPTTLPPTAAFGRSSRFFGPSAERSGISVISPPVIVERTSYGAPSPPPPDSAEFAHPAFDRSGHPLVNLPMPPPKVRLPPASSPEAASASINGLQDSGFIPPRFRSGPQPIVNSADWQARINNLFGNRSAPRPGQGQILKSMEPSATHSAALPAPPVDTSSKTAFDVATVAATVSLPTLPFASELKKNLSNPAALPDHHIQSIPCIEDLMDDREFGDIPTVLFPQVSEHCYAYLQSYKRLLPRLNSLEEGPFNSTVYTEYVMQLLPVEKAESGTRIHIRILGKAFASKIMSRKVTPASTPSNPRSVRNKKRGTINKFGNGSPSHSETVSPRINQTLNGSPPAPMNGTDRQNYPNKSHRGRGGRMTGERFNGGEMKQQPSGSDPTPWGEQPFGSDSIPWGEQPFQSADSIPWGLDGTSHEAPQESNTSRGGWAKPPKGPGRGRGRGGYGRGRV